MAEEQTAVAEVTGTETAAPEVDNEAVAQSEMEAIWEKHNADPGEDTDQPADRPRDEQGRFTKAEGETAEADESADEQPQEGEEAAAAETDSDDQPEGEAEADEQASAPAIEPPQAWSKEAREYWAKIPAEAQQVIAQREAEAHKYISQLGQQVKSVEPILNTLNQHRDLFAGRGVSYEDGINELIGAQRYLTRDPVGGIQWLAEAYGVDLSIFGNSEGEESGQSPVVASLQSQLSNAYQRIEQLSQRVEAREMQEAQAFLSTAEQEAERFKAEKQIDEATEMALVDRVAWYTQNHPNMPIRERLEKAYDDLTWTDPVRRQQAIEREFAAKQEAAQKAAMTRAEKAKKAGSVNVKSSPVSSKEALTIDQALERRWSELQAS